MTGLQPVIAGTVKPADTFGMALTNCAGHAITGISSQLNTIARSFVASPVQLIGAVELSI